MGVLRDCRLRDGGPSSTLMESGMNARISELKRSHSASLLLMRRHACALHRAATCKRPGTGYCQRGRPCPADRLCLLREEASCRPQEAERRLAIQDRAAGIEDEIIKVLGDQYAGIWYDEADGGKLKIGMTPAAPRRAEDVRRIAERRGILADMDFVTVRYTQAELEQKQDDIRKRIEDIIDAGRARTSYNTKSNTVVVTAIAALPPLEEARVNDLAKISGVTVRRFNVPTLRGRLHGLQRDLLRSTLWGGRGIRRRHLPSICRMHRRIHRTRQYQSKSTVGLDRRSLHFLRRLAVGGKGRIEQLERVGFSGFYSFSGAPGRDAGKISISANVGGGWASPTPKPFVVVKSSSNPRG